MFLLVAVSTNASYHLDEYVKRFETSPWVIQQILVADSLRNWSSYMACLKADLNNQKRRILAADIGSKAQESLNAMNIIITFEDRQELAELQDATQELQLIFPALLQTVKRIRGQCQKIYCTSTMNSIEQKSYHIVMDEFDEFVYEIELLVQRAEVLVEQAKAATNLVSSRFPRANNQL